MHCVRCSEVCFMLAWQRWQSSRPWENTIGYDPWLSTGWTQRREETEETMGRLLSRRAGLSLFVLAALGAAAPSTAASAQDYPSRPVRMIVPQAAGGGTDVFARALGQRLSERWGQPVIIDNRAGAAGVIGTGAVA